MSTCWNCQAPVEVGESVCHQCGTTLTLGADSGAREPDLPCRQCGEATPYGALFCGICGTRDPHGAPGVVELDRGGDEHEANLIDAVEAPAQLDRTMVSPATLAAQAIEELDAEAPVVEAPPSALPLDFDVEVTHPRHRATPPPRRATVVDGGAGRPVPPAEPAPVRPPEGDTVLETQRPARRPKPTTHQTITKQPRALADRPQGARARLSLTPAPRPSGGEVSDSAPRVPSRPPPRPPGAASSERAGAKGREASVARIAVERAVVAGPAASGDASVAVEPLPDGASSSAVESGAPDITEEIAEIRFFILQGLDDEARAALEALRAEHAGHPDLEAVEREVSAASPASSAAAAAPDDTAEREAEAQAKREAEEKAKREAEAKAKREAEAKAKREAEEKAKREAEEKAKREAEAKAKREAEAKAKREAEEKAKREAEEKAKREAEEKAKREAAEKAERDAEEKARVDAEAERRMIEVEDAELALTQAEQDRRDEAERAERAEASARRVTAEEIAAIDAARLAADLARAAEREAQEAERAAVLARERANTLKREATKAAAAAEAAQRAAKRIAVSREVKVAVAERAKEAELAKAAEVARATEAARLARAAVEAARPPMTESALDVELPDDFETDEPAPPMPIEGADSSDIELGAVVDLVRRESAVLDLGESSDVELGLVDPSPDEATAVRGRTMPTPVVPRTELDPYDDEPAPADLEPAETLAEEAAPELVEELVLDRGRGSSGLLEVDLEDVEEIDDDEIDDDEIVEAEAAPAGVVVRDRDLPAPEELAVDLDDLDELAPDPGPARTGRTVPPGLVTSASAHEVSENTVVTRGPQPARPYEDDSGPVDVQDGPRHFVARTTVVPGDPSRPAEPAPYREASASHAALVDPIAAAAASGEFRSEENTEPSPPPAPAAVVRTQEGTVIAPMVGGKAGIPVAPIRLVALGADGEPTAERVLGPGEAFEIGRQASQPWSADTQMSVRHVKVRPAPGGAILDEIEPNAAVFTKVSERSAVRDGDEFKVGRSQLRWQRLPPGSDAAVLGHLTVYKYGAAAAEAYPVGGAGLLLGRDEGDVVFPGDTFVSGHHCRFSCEGPDVYVEDLGSSNGTYLRVRSGEAVGFGSLLLIGHTQFVVEPA